MRTAPTQTRSASDPHAQSSDGAVIIRDSKDAERGQSLAFTADEWTAFVAGVKAGELDLS